MIPEAKKWESKARPSIVSKDEFKKMISDLDQPQEIQNEVDFPIVISPDEH